MRNAMLVIVSMVMASGVTAKPTINQPARPDYAKAYNYALRCFALTSADAQASDATSKPAFDAATKLGTLQGFDNRRINADFSRTSAQEIIKLANSDSYRQQLLADCRRLGLTP